MTFANLALEVAHTSEFPLSLSLCTPRTTFNLVAAQICIVVLEVGPFPISSE